MKPLEIKSKEPKKYKWPNFSSREQEVLEGEIDDTYQIANQSSFQKNFKALITHYKSREVETFKLERQKH